MPAIMQTHEDIQDYLDENFPELKSEVSLYEGCLHVKITYNIGFDAHFSSANNKMLIKHLLVNSLYRAIGNLTVLATKVRDEL